MKTADLIELLNDPTQYEINKQKPRAFKRSYGTNQNALSYDLNGTYGFTFCQEITQRNAEFHLYNTFVTTIEVPGHIELQGHGQIHYVNTQYPWDGVENVSVGSMPMTTNYCGQYGKNFTFYKEDENRYWLNFEGVANAFNVWLNGHYIGYATDTFTTSEFDVTEYLSSGNNYLAIEVYRFSASSWLEDQDFWRLSGIFRDVQLLTITPQAILDYSITYDLDITKREANVELSTESQASFRKTLMIYDGQTCIKELTFEGDVVRFTLSDLTLWSAEIPHLYRFKIMSATEDFEKEIGFRSIMIKDKVILLNGKRLFFKGINRHEFDPFKGRAIGYEEIYKDLTLLKEHHFNAIRTSHYPNNNLFYELCDRLGFYVIDEVNLETHGTYMVMGQVDAKRELLPGNDQRYKENVLQRAKNLYHRDKNITSVLLWSLGNESFEGETLLAMHRYFKEVDTSRLVHYEGVSINSEASDVESQMYTRSEAIETYLTGDYQKPFVLCEFSHAMGNSNGNFDDYMALERKYPSYHGGFIWEYMDQAIYYQGKFRYGGDFGDRPTDYNFICDGLVGVNREITSELQYLARAYHPLQVEKSDRGFRLMNTHLFKDYNQLTVRSYRMDYHTPHEVRCEVIALPAQTAYDFTYIDQNYLYNVEIYAENQPLQRLSYGTFPLPKVIVERDVNKVRFVDGDCNFGLHGEHFSVIFSKDTQNISSIKYHGEEFFDSITTTFKPNFWRSPTDNDRGAKKQSELAILHNLTYYQYSQLKEYRYENHELKVKILFKHHFVQDYHCEVTYHINALGKIEVTQHVMPLSVVDYLFCVGVYAKLNPAITQYRYVGNGPMDSYCDRQEGLVKSCYHQRISEMKSYLYPQEFGNKTDVDWLHLQQESGKGWEISGHAMEFSVKNYSDNHLMDRRNRQDLSEDSPFLRLHAKQTGVAGDDSWGSWVKERFLIQANQEHLFQFTINLQ